MREWLIIFRPHAGPRRASGRFCADTPASPRTTSHSRPPPPPELINGGGTGRRPLGGHSDPPLINQSPLDAANLANSGTDAEKSAVSSWAAAGEALPSASAAAMATASFPIG